MYDVASHSQPFKYQHLGLVGLANKQPKASVHVLIECRHVQHKYVAAYQIVHLILLVWLPKD